MSTPAPAAVSMWDFSWLCRRHGDEAEYADPDRRLDELADRGYDCVRIDAFPHLVAAGDGPFTIRPQPKRFPWGNHRPVPVKRPAAHLVDFVGKARARGVRVALSSWFVPDAAGHKGRIRTAEDLARVWIAALDRLADADLLGNVAFVDLCNEFPLGLWLPGVYRRLFGAPWWNPAPLLRRWDARRRAAVSSFVQEAVSRVRQAHPGLRYTFSLQAFGAGNLRRADLACLDLAEVHVWLGDDRAFSTPTLHLATALGAPGALAIHRRRAPRVFARDRDRWLTRLAARMDRWQAWAEPLGLPLWTSERWASIVWDERPGGAGWGWVKSVCEAGVDLALDRGWAGVCTSNFSQPHFAGVWDDAPWHRALTARIRQGVAGAGTGTSTGSAR